MNVTCPQCRTVYRLPDDKAKAGAKLRCSVCRHVFSLPEEERIPQEEVLSFGSGPASVEAPKRADDDLQLSGLSEPSARREEGLSLGEAPRRDLDMALDDTVRGVLDDASFDDSLSISAPAENGRLEEFEEKKRGRLDGAFSLLLCIGLVFGGIWAWKHTTYLDGLKALIMPYISPEDSAPAEPSALLEKLEIRDWRQYQVKNEKLGALIVIEGKVKNNFTAPRELIRLEAQLFDAQGTVLASKQQLAGASLSAFQLQLLDKEELEKALNSKLDIIASNIDVLPGGEVPFMVVFTDIPAGASDFKLRIIEASVPKSGGNLTE
ncbi:DUF3426 domain-containing protein [Mailhella sp.]|uniref:DUF3426 domain-containing protein n=1 Tax=Mailhella sp. TaxID=1981029 RepID=UPI004064A27C